MKRWTFLSFLLVTLLLSVADAAERVPLGDQLSVEKLSSTLWQFRASHSWDGGDPIEANGLFVIGQRGIAMIDTGWTDAQAATLIDWVESATSKRVLYVVATHWHWDRMGGMAEVNRRGIRGVAQRRSAAIGRENEIEPPPVLFESRLRIDLGGQAIELFFPGGGHTEDNIVVWIDQPKLLYGGCMVKSATSGIGYLADATLDQWERSLERVAKRYPQTERLLPGHGKAGGLELLDHTAGLVRAALNPER